MPTKIESAHAGEFVVSEGNNSISRDFVQLVKSITLIPGTVLGQNTETGLYGPLDPAATDGREIAAAIVFDHNVVGKNGGGAVVIKRHAEVSGALLVWPATITEEQQAAAVAQLETQHIIVR